jgi:hypothetical protein
MNVLNNEESARILSIVSRRRDGDDIIVAEATGYSADYVRKCLKEKRNNKLILAIYQQLLDNRDEFIRSRKAIAELVKSGKYPLTK